MGHMKRRFTDYNGEIFFTIRNILKTETNTALDDTKVLLHDIRSPVHTSDGDHEYKVYVNVEDL